MHYNIEGVIIGKTHQRDIFPVYSGQTVRKGSINWVRELEKRRYTYKFWIDSRLSQ